MVMQRGAVTRRRALALGAAAGVGVLLGEPAYARNASFTREFPAGRLGTTLRVGRRFDLVGVAGMDAARHGIELRARRRGGRWSAWTTVGGGRSHAPDGAPRAPSSDPVWTGAADELQVRARRAPRGPLRLAFVAVGDVPRRTVRARAAQNGAPPIITRDQWGARAPKATPSYGAVNMAFIHHTENANDYGPGESAAIVLAIQRYHQDHNGWNDIGYNLLVDRYGQVFEGRAGGIDQAVVGAQAEGWNSKSTGIATIGGFMKTGYPEEGMAVLARLVAWKLALHGVPAQGTVELPSGGGSSNRYPYGRLVTLERISGHRDGCATDCPGDVLYGQLADLRARAAKLQGTIVTRPTVALSAAAHAVRYGDDAVFSGRLLGADGVPVGSTRVSVQKQGRSGWVTLAHATTDTDGTFQARLPWRRSGVVRVQATVPGVQGAVRSPQVDVAVTPIIRTTAPGARSRVRAGDALTVGGSIRPAAAVTLVVERQGRDGRWRRTQAVRARVRGQRFAAPVRLRTPGLYRVTAKTDGGATAPVYVRAVRSQSDVGGTSADA